MLTGDVIMDIIRSKMAIIEKDLAKRGLFIKYVGEEEKDARELFYEYLKNIGTDEENGARPLERTIEEKLGYPIDRQFYFLRDRDAVEYTVKVTLTGEPPKTEVKGTGGKYTARDRRTITIELIPRN